MEGFAGVIDEAILQSIGVELRGDNEYLVWSQFTRVPTKSYWGDMDLIMLAKTANMEADIRAAQVKLDAIGMVFENKRGT